MTYYDPTTDDEARDYARGEPEGLEPDDDDDDDDGTPDPEPTCPF
ncbi:MAG TPA: hypothetical protein VIY27_09250 [Myxococcota bacterium]